MAENVAPPIDDFCVRLRSAEQLVIRFPGGVTLQPQIDPSKGASPCSLSLGLSEKLDAALAPFQPFLNLLDVVAHLAQCMLLMVDALSNPFKVPDLIKCLPALLEKLNEILKLVPALPQGVVAYVTFVVDVIRAAAAQLDCVIETLRSIQEQLDEVNRTIAAAREVDDPQIAENLLVGAQCAQESIATQTSSALASLASIARILCTIKAILVLIPGGRPLVKTLAFPDPTSIESIDGAISTLEGLRGALLFAVDAISVLADPLGGIGVPTLAFKCPVDDLPDEEEVPEPPAEPTIAPDGVTDEAGVPIVTIGQSGGPDDPPVKIVINGTNYLPTSQVFWDASKVGAADEEDAVQRVSVTRIVVLLPANLLTNVGIFQLSVVNVSEAAGGLFGGLSATPGTVPDETGVRTSNQFAIEVA